MKVRVWGSVATVGHGHAQRVERDRSVDHIGDDPRPRNGRRERPNHRRSQQGTERGHPCEPESHSPEGTELKAARRHGKFPYGGKTNVGTRPPLPNARCCAHTSNHPTNGTSHTVNESRDIRGDTKPQGQGDPSSPAPSIISELAALPVQAALYVFLTRGPSAVSGRAGNMTRREWTRRGWRRGWTSM